MGYELRGTCKEACEKLLGDRPDLRLVRGHYFCPYWDTDNEHWWCVDAEGNIVDPTASQFPSNGHGTYTEFNGTVACAQCGADTPEDQVYGYGNYGFCSTRCAMRFVGL